MKLHPHVELKEAEYKQSALLWRRFREAYNKRQEKHEYVRDAVQKELNVQFNKCAIPLFTAYTLECTGCSLTLMPLPVVLPARLAFQRELRPRPAGGFLHD